MDKLKTIEAPITSKIDSSITAHADKWRHNLDQQRSKEILLERSDSLDKLIKKSKPEFDGFMRSFLSDSGKKGIFLDIDGTLAHFAEPGKHVTLPSDVLTPIQQTLDKGHCIAIITGRTVPFVRRLLQQAKASNEYINRIEISGEYGAVHQGPSTEGEKKVRKDLQLYINHVPEILKNIEKLIEDDPTMKGIVKIYMKTLGATIHYRGYKELLAAQNLSREVINQKIVDLNQKIIYSMLKAIEEDKAFSVKHNSTGYDLVLNEEKTGIRVSKGTAAETLVKELDLVSVLAIGDDLTDLEMQKHLQKLVASADGSLKSQAFVGVRHIREDMPTPEEIEHDSTAVVAGPDQVAQLLAYIAKRIKPLS